MALVAAPARADNVRVIVVDAETRVADAIDVALSPWGLVVLRAPGPLPEPDIVTALARAHAIAGKDHAGAVIWIEPPGPGSFHPSLWVYAAETQQLAVRPLGASPPFDEAGAAAVALSVKTILRGSTLDASSRPPPPAQAQAPSRSATAPRAAEHIESRSAGVEEQVWRLEADAAVQTPTGTSEAVQMRAGLGVSVWPERARGRLGVGVNLHSSPGLPVDTSVFHGQVMQGSLEATARLRGSAAPWLAFELQAGPALLLVSLDGETRPTPKSANSLKLNPGWEAAGVIDFRLGARTCLGASVGASGVFRPQSYTVDYVFPVITEPRAVALFGVRLSLGVD